MATTSTKHVVLFPFPGQGHLAAFLQVARLLRRALPGDVKITIVSTPRNVAALRASSSASASSYVIGFHALPFFPADHGLPAECESTSSLLPPEFLILFEAFESLRPPLTPTSPASSSTRTSASSSPTRSWRGRCASRAGAGAGTLSSCPAARSARPSFTPCGRTCRRCLSRTTASCSACPSTRRWCSTGPSCCRRSSLARLPA
ncbi:hypothetical protein ZWY2020_021993 [Hordeum vulgare]|nr:hypothetical protein ZWY2020_021993 [Hordeum vulgare]